jgi:glyoxylase-like metal-dependent hydrolase (beta-lactamase superfamily II)
MQPDVAHEILPATYRFEAQTFYGEDVGVYLVELSDRVVIVDIPAFRPDAVAFVRSFHKPVEAIATHGPTIIHDTVRWQQELQVQVSLHERDRADIWLSGVPDRLFSMARHHLGRLEILHTPGHSEGSVCILDRETGALFSGDTVAATKRGDIRDMHRGSSHDSDSKQRLASVSGLCSKEFTSILPFHYSPLIGGGRDKLLRYFEQNGTFYQQVASAQSNVQGR